MSMLCDIFVTNHAGALAYAHDLSNDGETSQSNLLVKSYSNLLPDHFNALASILLANKDSQRTFGLIHVTHEENGAWWLEQFTPEFMAELSKANVSEIESIAEGWMNSASIDFDSGGAQTLIKDLHELAVAAIAQQTGMYMWGSL